jgi:hypothetical protein
LVAFHWVISLARTRLAGSPDSEIGLRVFL